MAVPLQPSVQQEVQIARLSQLLQRPDLSDEVRAKMHYERGSYYDSVGLRDLARLDFNQSLQLNPAQPDIFNLLGVYFTQVGEFDAAYEAFDSTIELAPDNTYAERNRAIALYYGGRIDLALEDMTKHYQEMPTDPFRSLWLYIIEAEQNPEQAKANLQQRYLRDRSEEWGWVLVAIMLRDVSDEDALKAIMDGTRENYRLAERLTERISTLESVISLKVISQVPSHFISSRFRSTFTIMLSIAILSWSWRKFTINYSKIDWPS